MSAGLSTARVEVKRRETRAKKVAYVRAYKLEHGCEKCGYNQHAEVLDLDHRNPEEKEFALGNALKHGWGKLKAELAKCRVLCANCHRIHTFNLDKEPVDSIHSPVNTSPSNE